MLHGNQLKARADLGRDFLEVLHVSVREEDGLEALAIGGEDLLLEAAMEARVRAR